MTIASALFVAKRAVADVLAAAITTANVDYEAPLEASDLKTGAGTYDAVWLGDASASLSIPNFKAGAKHFDENGNVTVIIQCMRPTKTGTQRAADIAAEGLLNQVLTLWSADPSFGIVSPVRMDFLVADLNIDAGYLDGTGGHAARIEIEFSYSARLTP